MSGSNDHVRVGELLPWFVNGTLSPPERALVERHVNECLPCRKALNDERRLVSAVSQAAISPHSPEYGLDELLRSIDASGRRTRRLWRPAGVDAAPSTWPALAIAATAAVIAVGLWISLGTVPRPAADGSYSTLSLPLPPSVRIDVVLENGIESDVIDALTGQLGGRVVDGPSEIGRYTIEIDRSAAAASDVERTLGEIREDPRVRFAARSFLGEQN